MTTVAQARVEELKQPIWLFKIYLDYCTLEYGAGACTAVGPKTYCFYTFYTSEDPDNFDKGTRTYSYTNRGAPYVAGACPYIKSFDFIPTEIEPDKFNTVRSKLTVHMAEDNAHPETDPTKAATRTGAGRYWPSLIKRNQNYHGRLAELWQGFEGVDSANFTLYWRGRLDTINLTKDGVDIVCYDMLQKTSEASTPPEIPDSVTISALTAIATTVTVSDGSKYLAASANQPRCIRVDDEYITYTNDPSLTDTIGTAPLPCTRGAFGSMAAIHDAGTKAEQVLVYSEDDANSWADCSEIEADRIFLDLLCNLAGISAEYIACTDAGAELDGAINDAVTSLTLNNSALVPETGYGYIDTEMVRWTAKAANVLTIQRGVMGTTAAAHADEAIFYVPNFTHEIGRWRAGGLFSNRIESNTNIADLIWSLSQAVGCNVWCNEDGQIDCRMQAPALNISTITSIDESKMVRDSRTVKLNEESRLTRVWVFYNPTEPDAGESDDEYDGIEAYVDGEAESANAYDEIKDKKFYCPWLKSQTQAAWTAQHIWMAYTRAATEAEFELEIYHDDLKTGDLIRLAMPEVVTSDGAAETRWHRIIRKVRKALNEIAFKTVNAGYGDDKHGVIGPPNGILDVGIDDAITTIDVDLSGTALAFADFRTDGTHHIIIEDEKISYTTAADQGGDVVRLSGGARGVDGTANVAHLAGVDVLMLYSGAADDHRLNYSWISDVNGQIDGDGDLTADSLGDLIF